MTSPPPAVSVKWRADYPGADCMNYFGPLNGAGFPSVTKTPLYGLVCVVGCSPEGDDMHFFSEGNGFRRVNEGDRHPKDPTLVFSTRVSGGFGSGSWIRGPRRSDVITQAVGLDDAGPLDGGAPGEPVAAVSQSGEITSGSIDSGSQHSGRPSLGPPKDAVSAREPLSTSHHTTLFFKKLAQAADQAGELGLLRTRSELGASIAQLAHLPNTLPTAYEPSEPRHDDQAYRDLGGRNRKHVNEAENALYFVLEEYRERLTDARAVSDRAEQRDREKTLIDLDEQMKSMREELLKLQAEVQHHKDTSIMQVGHHEGPAARVDASVGHWSAPLEKSVAGVSQQAESTMHSMDLLEGRLDKADQAMGRIQQYDKAAPVQQLPPHVPYDPAADDATLKKLQDIASSETERLNQLQMEHEQLRDYAASLHMPDQLQVAQHLVPRAFAAAAEGQKDSARRLEKQSRRKTDKVLAAAESEFHGIAKTATQLVAAVPQKSRTAITEALGLNNRMVDV